MKKILHLSCRDGFLSAVPRFHPRRGLPLALGLWLLAMPNLKAQSDDFDDGNDTGWSRFDPLGGLGAGPRAIFTFPDGAYRIQALTSPAPSTAGPARAGSLRNDATYSSFYIEVDLVNWDDTVDQSIGLLGRIQPNWGLGTVNGYAFTYQALDRDVQMFRVVNEAPSAITPTASLALDPANTYRMVLKGDAENLTGEIYLAGDMTTPLISITGEDHTFASGVCGLVIYDGSSGGASTADATFDNYFAAAAQPEPPPRLTIGYEWGDLIVRWPRSASNYVLQSTINLDPANWTTVTDDLFEENDEFGHVHFASNETLFFRLLKP